MFKKMNLAAVAIIMASAFVLTSCSSDNEDEVVTPSIIGKWKVVSTQGQDNMVGIILEFGAGGSLKINSQTAGKWILLNTTMTWELSGNPVQYTSFSVLKQTDAELQLHYNKGGTEFTLVLNPMQ